MSSIKKGVSLLNSGFTPLASIWKLYLYPLVMYSRVSLGVHPTIYDLTYISWLSVHYVQIGLESERLQRDLFDSLPPRISFSYIITVKKNAYLIDRERNIP